MIRNCQRGSPRAELRNLQSCGARYPATWRAVSAFAVRLRRAPRHSASLGPHRDVGGGFHRELVRAVPVGMAEQDVAVADQRLLPVAALAARRQQALLDDVLAVAVEELVQAVDAGDPAV